MSSVLKYGNFGLKFLTGTGFVRLGDIASEPSLPADTYSTDIPMAFLYNASFLTDGGFRYFY